MQLGHSILQGLIKWTQPLTPHVEGKEASLSPTPIPTMSEDSWGSEGCGGVMFQTKALWFLLFTSGNLLHSAFILLSAFSACFSICLLPGYHSNPAAQSSDNSGLCMRPYERFGAMKPCKTIEFQIFLFSKAFGHAASGQLQSSGLGGGPRVPFLPTSKSALFLWLKCASKPHKFLSVFMQNGFAPWSYSCLIQAVPQRLIPQPKWHIRTLYFIKQRLFSKMSSDTSY